MHPNVVMNVVILVSALVLCGRTSRCCRSTKQIRDDGDLSRGENHQHHQIDSWYFSAHLLVWTSAKNTTQSKQKIRIRKILIDPQPLFWQSGPRQAHILEGVVSKTPRYLAINCRNLWKNSDLGGHCRAWINLRMYTFLSGAASFSQMKWWMFHEN